MHLHLEDENVALVSGISGLGIRSTGMLEVRNALE